MVDPGEHSSIAQSGINLPLPSFQSPPVIEVVCSIQFEELQTFSSVHYGQFLEWVKDQYPKTEERVPVADRIEPIKPLMAITTETLEIPPLRRVFYVAEGGSFLLQVQPSRFMANWRRMSDADPYPRFPAAHARFLEGWDSFLRFAKEHGLGTPKANQYELTYINHIEAIDRPFPEAIEQVMPAFSWAATRSIGFLPLPTSFGMRLRFPLPEDAGALHVKIDLARRNRDKKEVLVLDFTARGAALSDFSNMNNWFALAHEWIVNGFTDLTSKDAHRRWGRIE